MAKFRDLTGQRFGQWKVLEYIGDRKWKCECQCEKKTIKDVATYSLTSGASTSCGCERKLINSASKVDDLTGKQFGDWKVIRYIGHSYWECECSCKTIKKVKAQSLKSGASTSCGHSTTGFKDLTGMKFGKWNVLEYSGNQKWKCQCDCCNEIRDIESYNLINGLSTSCGKNRISSKIIDLTGQVFGELTVVGYVGGNKWLCNCSCGEQTIKYSHNLRRSDTISCGCKDLKYTKEEIIHAIEEFKQENGELPFRDDLITLLDRSQSSITRYIEKYNLEEYLNKSYRSRQERELHKLFPTKFTNIRSILHGKYEIDLFYPENNIGIEFDGSYWHSELFKDKMYHQNKSIECNKNNIDIIHIFEYEWDNEEYKNKLIKLIKRKLNKNEDIRKIYARDTSIKVISHEDTIEFLDKYHLQGSISSSINLGLVLDNELLGLMSFGKSRFNQNYQYEMLRMCWKDNIQVIGGASKLFNAFLKKYDPVSVISYVDFAKFNGTVYEKMGFKYNGITSPNYVWWNIKENIKLSRYETMKYKLIEKGIGDKSQTEDEIMRNLGYIKIFDCGNLIYIWNK